MKYSILVLAFLHIAYSSVIPHGVTIGLTPYSHPIQSLYHAQDNLGQYVYGYSTPTSSKTETKSANGVTQGGYSYIDSNGILQSVHYTADAVNGFRVAASNLPQDLPDVAYAKAKHLAEFASIKSDHDQIAAARAVHYSNPVVVPISAVPQIPISQQLPQPVQDLPEVAKARAQHLAALNAAYSASPIVPQVVQDLPEVVKARAEHLNTVEAIKQRDAIIRQNAISLSPIPNELSGTVIPVHTVAAPVANVRQVSYTPAIWHAPSSQYHAQDNWGQYSYGYVSPLSSKAESRTADGVTRGGYSYIDANGIVQTVNYVADALGFRVAGTNIPVDVNARVAAVTSAHAPVIQSSVVAATPVVEKKIVAAPVPVSTLYTHELVY